MAKNEAAAALSRLRWAGKTDEERKAVGRALGLASAKSMTKAQRSERSAKAAAARIAQQLGE